MKKKKLEKRDTKNDKYYYLATIIIASIVGFFIFKEAGRRNKLIENNSFTTYGKIEKLKENASKSTVTTKDVIYFYFINDNIAYHKVTDRPNYFISNNNIKIGDVFKVKVVTNDFNIFRIGLKKKIDTVIAKREFSKEIFNSQKHKEIIKH